MDDYRSNGAFPNNGAIPNNGANPNNGAYRNNRVQGATFFFTVRLLDRHSALLTEHIAAFGEAIRQTRLRKPFHVDAWVVLPDHAHAIWTLPPGDKDTAVRWNAVKIVFSKALRKAGLRIGSGTAVWAPNYQQHAVRDQADYGWLIDYIHADPQRHGFCALPEHWPWSSVHRFSAEKRAL
ncbi:MAG: transposase [Pseudomonadota bacterium]